MHWTGWIVVVLMTINAGFMAFDGFRALIVGDYITPSSGEYAGQLGPWSKLVEAVGIKPRSTLMKVLFVGYGLITLLTLIAFILQLSWSWWAVLAMAVLGLWYLPFGTIINLISVILLLLPVLWPG